MHTPLVPIADDIFQVHLPLPFALNRVNCYLIRGSDGWSVLDTGLNTAEGRAAWNTAFAALDIRPADITQVILTHAHPDHFGMAGWFQEQAGAPVGLSAREAAFARAVWLEGHMGEGFDRYLVQLGMPPDMAQTVARGVASTGEMTYPHPTRFSLLQAGDEIQIGQRRFVMIHTPGHSDGQLVFYDADDQLLLCGDHVLMKITPNIGLWPDSDPNPLGRFLASLRDLKALEVRLALPGHKALITDWRGRLDELIAHHEARLQHTLAAVADWTTVYQAARQVFNSDVFSPHEWRFAMAETLAHLDYLERHGQVTRDDSGEVWRFRRL
ncbi:MAG: MBL fold metallo-hydrolase [Chloroflexi bacterium]|nr:MBL fold metallo-hydrolase [Chloroflexota bacterium]